MFKYKINQIENINTINIRITNQDNEEITTLGDWQLTFQFEQHYENVTEKKITANKRIYYLYFFINWKLFILIREKNITIIYIQNDENENQTLKKSSRRTKHK